jgi:heme-degrading monooxygenase HmoA
VFAVIFEVQPKKEQFDEYLNLAKFLKPELEKIDGFIDNERFVSQRTEGRVLSLSTWRDEKAVIRWRTLGVHHEVQEKGRFEVFEDYHLRVGEITADTEVPKGQTLRDQRLDETETGEGKVATITELSALAGEKPASTNLALEGCRRPGATASSVRRSSRASTIPASCCSSSPGKMRPRPNAGSRRRSLPEKCATAAFASSATTA